MYRIPTPTTATWSGLFRSVRLWGVRWRSVGEVREGVGESGVGNVVVVDVERFEDCLVDVSSSVVAGCFVASLAVGQECERLGEVVLDVVPFG